MVKPAAFAPKPAVAKLPLAVRKDIRDNFDAKKEDLESRIKALVGVDFHININAAEVWAYAEADNTSAGTCFSGYVEGFISALQRFVEKYEEHGKTFFNEAVAQSELTLAVHPLGDKGETIAAEVKDGVYRILFRHDRLGYNQNWQDDTILPAIQAVPREGFSLSATHSIENDFDAEIDEVKAEINTILGMDDVILDPNFSEVYKALSELKDNDWQASIGSTVMNYFKGLKYQLESQGFKADDMLQEGLQEMVPSKTFKIRVLPKTKSTTETVIEDGVVYLQTAPDRWGYNTNYMGEGLLQML